MHSYMRFILEDDLHRRTMHTNAVNVQKMCKLIDEEMKRWRKKKENFKRKNEIFSILSVRVWAGEWIKTEIESSLR